MRIGIDARLLVHRRGIGNYTYGLLTGLSEISSSHQFILYVAPGTSEHAMPRRAGMETVSLGSSNYVVNEQWELCARAAADGLDLLHCTANTAPLFPLGKTRLILTVHDLMFLFPSSYGGGGTLYQRLGAFYRRAVVPRAARRASLVVTVSEQTARDLVQHVGVPRERIKTIHEAAGPQYRQLEPTQVQRLLRAQGIDGDYVLALGAEDPRKNTARIIRAFRRFQQSAPFPMRLVISGLSEHARHRFSKVAASAQVRDSVTFLGFVPEEVLIALYNGAQMLLYPSLYEGFGLPLLEAMACGTGVVTSERGSIPEIAGDAAVMVDPESEASIAQGMLEVAGQPELRKSLVERGLRRAAGFSWRRNAELTLQAYEMCTS